MMHRLSSFPVFPENTAHYAVSWSPEDETWFNKAGIVLPANLAKAVPKRRAEFLAGRYCAHKSLEQISADSVRSVNVNSDRSPDWPDGIVGSITHSGQFAAAVVARSSRYRGIGIDTENVVDAQTAERLKSLIMSDAEMNQLKRLSHTRSFAEIFTLVFSAKESIYKCLRPLVKSFFGFHSACVVGIEECGDESGMLMFTLSQDLDWSNDFPTLWTVRWVLESHFAHTCVYLPRELRAGLT